MSTDDIPKRKRVLVDLSTVVVGIVLGAGLFSAAVLFLSHVLSAA